MFGKRILNVEVYGDQTIYGIKSFKDKIVVPEKSLFCDQISVIDTYITNQNFVTSTFLTNALAYYATLASPTFSGTVTLPNNQTITSTTTPFLSSVNLSPYAPLASPTFSGTVTLPNGSTINQYTPAYLTSIPSTYLTTSSTIPSTINFRVRCVCTISKSNFYRNSDITKWFYN